MNAAAGPTLNLSYNALLVRWGNIAPECEDCGKDLTGEHVHDTGISWLCSDCNDAFGEDAVVGVCEREDFHSDG